MIATTATTAIAIPSKQRQQQRQPPRPQESLPETTRIVDETTATNTRPVEKNAHNGPRGAGPRHDVRKGSRLVQRLSRQSVCSQRLARSPPEAPPGGQHWVQAGSDYVLVAVATGIIAQVLLNN